MSSLRLLSRSTPIKSFTRPFRPFSTTRPALVKVGDPIPSTSLVEDSPGNKVNLAEELAEGDGLIIGVPAAFSKLPFGYV